MPAPLPPRGAYVKATIEELTNREGCLCPLHKVRFLQGDGGITATRGELSDQNKLQRQRVRRRTNAAISKGRNKCQPDSIGFQAELSNSWTELQSQWIADVRFGSTTSETSK